MVLIVVVVDVVVFDRTHILIGRREKDSKAAASGRCSSMPLSLSHFLSHVLEKGERNKCDTIPDYDNRIQEL